MSDRIEPEQTGPRLFSQMGEDESAPKQSSLDSARIISADQQRKAFKACSAAFATGVFF